MEDKERYQFSSDGESAVEHLLLIPEKHLNGSGKKGNKLHDFNSMSEKRFKISEWLKKDCCSGIKGKKISRLFYPIVVANKRPKQQNIKKNDQLTPKQLVNKEQRQKQEETYLKTKSFFEVTKKVYERKSAFACLPWVEE